MDGRKLVLIALLAGGGFGIYYLLQSGALAATLQPSPDLTGTAIAPDLTTDQGSAPLPTPVIADFSTGIINSNNALDKINLASIPQLVTAIRTTETGNNPAQTSSAGALGAMQLLPATAQAMAKLLGIAYDKNRLLNDVAYNVQLGTEYLSTLYSACGGNKILAVTGYFAGPTDVAKWLQEYGVPNITLSAADWLAKIAPLNPHSAQYPYSVASHL